MRLIDADELKKEVPKKLVRLMDGQDYEETYYKYEVIKAINTVPTVDAIPIKWIENYVKNNFCFADWYGGFIGGINMMLDEWEKENETN